MCRCLQFLAGIKHFYFLSESERKGTWRADTELGYSASSHPALLSAARPSLVERDALCAPVDAGSLLAALLHRPACALTFIPVCGVLSTVGTPIKLHRCCSGNYWIYEVLFKVGSISLHHKLNVYFAPATSASTHHFTSSSLIFDAVFCRWSFITNSMKYFIQ